MAVNELGRIACRIGRNRFHGLFKELFGRRIGQDDAVSQMGKESEPEGIIFVHIEHAGNAYGTAGSLFRFQRLIMIEQAVVLYFVHIRQRLALFSR